MDTSLINFISSPFVLITFFFFVLYHFRNRPNSTVTSSDEIRKQPIYKQKVKDLKEKLKIKEEELIQAKLENIRLKEEALSSQRRERQSFFTKVNGLNGISGQQRESLQVNNPVKSYTNINTFNISNIQSTSLNYPNYSTNTNRLPLNSPNITPVTKSGALRLTPEKFKRMAQDQYDLRPTPKKDYLNLSFNEILTPKKESNLTKKIIESKPIQTKTNEEEFAKLAQIKEQTQTKPISPIPRRKPKILSPLDVTKMSQEGIKHKLGKAIGQDDFENFDFEPDLEDLTGAPTIILSEDEEESSEEEEEQETDVKKNEITEKPIQKIEDPPFQFKLPETLKKTRRTDAIKLSREELKLLEDDMKKDPKSHERKWVSKYKEIPKYNSKKKEIEEVKNIIQPKKLWFQKYSEIPRYVDRLNELLAQSKEIFDKAVADKRKEDQKEKEKLNLQTNNLPSNEPDKTPSTKSGAIRLTPEKLKELEKENNFERKWVKEYDILDKYEDKTRELLIESKILITDEDSDSESKKNEIENDSKNIELKPEEKKEEIKEEPLVDNRRSFAKKMATMTRYNSKNIQKSPIKEEEDQESKKIKEAQEKIEEETKEETKQEIKEETKEIKEVQETDLSQAIFPQKVDFKEQPFSFGSNIEQETEEKQPQLFTFDQDDSNPIDFHTAEATLKIEEKNTEVFDESNNNTPEKTDPKTAKPFSFNNVSLSPNQENVTPITKTGAIRLNQEAVENLKEETKEETKEEIKEPLVDNRRSWAKKMATITRYDSKNINQKSPIKEDQKIEEIKEIQEREKEISEEIQESKEVQEKEIKEIPEESKEESKELQEKETDEIPEEIQEETKEIPEEIQEKEKEIQESKEIQEIKEPSVENPRKWYSNLKDLGRYKDKSESFLSETKNQEKEPIDSPLPKEPKKISFTLKDMQDSNEKIDDKESTGENKQAEDIKQDDKEDQKEEEPSVENPRKWYSNLKDLGRYEDKSESIKEEPQNKKEEDDELPAFSFKIGDGNWGDDEEE